MSQNLSTYELVLSVMRRIPVGGEHRYSSNPTTIRRDSEDHYTFIYGKEKPSKIAALAIDVLREADCIVDETFHLSAPTTSPRRPSSRPPSSQQKLTGDS